jgi:hypothetical protein
MVSTLVYLYQTSEGGWGNRLSKQLKKIRWVGSRGKNLGEYNRKGRNESMEVAI